MTLMNRNRWVALAAALSVFMAAALTTKAFQRLRHPFPLWMTDAERWYDEAMGAALYAVAATACVVYLWRRRHYDRHGRTSEAGARPTRWRHKLELRIVLYCLAAVLVLQLPLGVVQTVRALHDDPPPWNNTFVSLFPIGGWLYPLIGIAIVIYDRCRSRREAREHSGACLKCGYDLRASPERCPECGHSPEKAKAPA